MCFCVFNDIPEKRRDRKIIISATRLRDLKVQVKFTCSTEKGFVEKACKYERFCIEILIRTVFKILLWIINYCQILIDER